MQVQVSKDNVSILNTDLTHVGEYNVDKLTFIFSQEYTDDLVKCAIFTNNAGKSYQTSILNNECFIPAEVLQERGNVIFGVYAYKVIEDKLELRYSPHPTYFDVLLGSYNQDVEESQEITPSQFEQYMQALNNGLNQVQDSISELNQATDNANDLVDEINKKLENGDFIGPQGPIGPQGEPGKDGTNGIDGVGITTITSGQATEENGNTITPITVEKTDGSSETFNVSAKNGIDGKNGQNGKDGINGTNGIDGQDGITPNIQIGTVETLEPTEEATVTRTGTDEEPLFNFGIPKGDKGDPGEVTEDMLDNVVPKQNVKDSIININDALKYKNFDFKVDGAYKQTTSDGSNLLDIDYSEFPKEQGELHVELNDDYSFTVTGTKTTTDWNNVSISLKTPIYFKTGVKYYIEDVIVFLYDLEGKWVKNFDNDFIPDQDYIAKNIPNVKGAYWTTNKQGTINETIRPYCGTVPYDEAKYYKYTGGNPSPNPDYPQNIETLNFDKIMKSGKNMLNVHLDETTSNEVTMSVDNQFIYINGKTPSTDGFRIITNTCLLPAGTYSINLQVVEGKVESTSTGYLFGIYKGTSWDLYAFLNINNSNKKASLSFTVDEPTEVCLGLYARDSDTYNNVKIAYQVTLGTEPDYEFEPYKGNNYSINLQGNEKVSLPNGVKDELQIDKEGNVNLNKKVGKVIYTDSNGFNNNGQTSTIISFICPVVENIPTNYGQAQDDIFLSNVIGSKYIGNGTSFNGVTNSGGIRINIARDFLNIQEESNSGYLNALNELIQSLNEEGKPFTIYYPLAEPQTISLGKLSDLISTENGSNTFAINGNIDTNISTTYALDLKKYIDNKIATVSSAVVEME